MENLADLPDGTGPEPRGAPTAGGEADRGVLESIRDLDLRLDRTLSVRETLQSELEESRARVETLLKQNELLVERVAYLEARDELAGRLKAELEGLRAEKSGSEKALGRMESLLRRLTEEKTSLEESYSGARTALEGMERKAGELESEVRRLRESPSVEEITDLLEGTRAKLATASERVGALEAELEASDAAKEAIVKDLRVSQLDVGMLRREVDALRKCQEDLERRVVRAINRITEELKVFL